MLVPSGKRAIDASPDVRVSTGVTGLECSEHGRVRQGEEGCRHRSEAVGREIRKGDRLALANKINRLRENKPRQ